MISVEVAMARRKRKLFNFLCHCPEIQDIIQRYLGKPEFVCFEDLSKIGLRLLFLFFMKANWLNSEVTPRGLVQLVQS